MAEPPTSVEDRTTLARRRKERTRKRRWPTAEQLRDAVIPDPDPVNMYVGRFPARLQWRQDRETFAIRVRGRDTHGRPQTLWVGDQPGQFPTVEGLLQAVEAKGQSVNQAARRDALTYERKAVRRHGSSRFTFERLNGVYRLRLETPNGKRIELRPPPRRDDRSAQFGPPVTLDRFDKGDHQEVALELARIMLDMVDSTTRTPTQLLDDAKELALEIQQWGRTFSVAAPDVSRWSQTRDRIRTIEPAAIDGLTESVQAPHPKADGQRLTATRQTTTRFGTREVKLTIHRRADSDPVVAGQDTRTTTHDINDRSKKPGRPDQQQERRPKQGRQLSLPSPGGAV